MEYTVFWILYFRFYNEELISTMKLNLETTWDSHQSLQKD